jgi:hypothetical protein
MQSRSLSAEFWRLVEAGEPDEAPRLVAVAKAIVIERADGWERLSEERRRLLKLRDAVIPGAIGKVAQRTVTAILDQYRATSFTADSARGFYLGPDPVRALCFEVITLSGGKLSARKLQRVFQRANKGGDLARSSRS